MFQFDWQKKPLLIRFEEHNTQQIKKKGRVMCKMCQKQVVLFPSWVWFLNNHLIISHACWNSSSREIEAFRTFEFYGHDLTYDVMWCQTQPFFKLFQQEWQWNGFYLDCIPQYWCSADDSRNDTLLSPPVEVFLEFSESLINALYLCLLSN